MTLETRARQAVQALEVETAAVDPIAAIGRIQRRQRRTFRLQLAGAAALVLVVLAGALLLRRDPSTPQLPVAPPSSSAAPTVRTVPATSTATAGGFPIPPSPPFPRAAANAFPPLFNSPKVRQLRQASHHPIVFPTWLPSRMGWTLSSTQVLDRLTDYRLRPTVSSNLEIEVFHSQVSDGRSTDPLDAPVRGLTMPNGLKVYVYQDVTDAGTEAYIISDRHEYVVVYFFNCDRDPPGQPGACLTAQERRQFLRSLAMLKTGK
jgi:hypothetical protein